MLNNHMFCDVTAIVCRRKIIFHMTIAVCSTSVYFHFFSHSYSLSLFIFIVCVCKQSFSQAQVSNISGLRLVEEIAKDLKSMLDIRIRAVKVLRVISLSIFAQIKHQFFTLNEQKIVATTQNLPKAHENKTAYVNYTFRNIRKRDRHQKEIKEAKDRKNKKLEELSQADDYKKKKTPKQIKEAMAEERICYKSDKKSNEEEEDDDGNSADDDDDDDDDDEDPPWLMSFFDEFVDVKSKESGIFLPLVKYKKLYQHVD
jgi:hypothetical protein